VSVLQRNGGITRTFIDLSITLDNDVASDPPFLRSQITYQTYGETLAELQHFFPGVKLDSRHMADGDVVTAADAEAEPGGVGHDLQPLDIVLVNTAAGKALGQPDYAA
jgi:hypothetical protein